MGFVDVQALTSGSSEVGSWIHHMHFNIYLFVLGQGLTMQP